MAINRVKVAVVTFVLKGVLFALVALLTKHWFEAETEVTEYDREGKVVRIRIHVYSGLWTSCNDYTTDSTNFHSTRCLSVSHALHSEGGAVSDKTQAARALSIIAILLAIPLLVLFCIFTARNYRNRTASIIIMVLTLLAACCQAAAVICAEQSRNEVPAKLQWELPLRLGWSFGLAAASSAMFGIAELLLISYYVTQERKTVSVGGDTYSALQT